MHDLAEGYLPLIMKEVFQHTLDRIVFTEDKLNWMVQFYSHGWLHRHNVPPSICLNKRSLGQNAVQSLCLFRNLSLILPDMFWRRIWKHWQIKRLLGDNRNFRNVNQTLAIKHQQVSCTNKVFSYKDEFETAKIEPISRIVFQNDKLNLICEQIFETNVRSFLKTISFFFDELFPFFWWPFPFFRR